LEFGGRKQLRVYFRQPLVLRVLDRTQLRFYARRQEQHLYFVKTRFPGQ
jgi:hypothetical protein